MKLPIIKVLEDLMSNTIQRYVHTIDVVNIKLMEVCDAHIKIMVGNWILGGFRWEKYNHINTFRLFLTYEELETISSNIVPCPTKIKLELLKAGYFPLDKLKELTRIRLNQTGKE